VLVGSAGTVNTGAIDLLEAFAGRRLCCSAQRAE
jgi:hypothetical protein